MNKDEIYDSEISPLIQQIIDIARAHGIAMFSSFNIAHDGEGPDGEDCTSLTCTSHLPDGDEVFDPRFSKCAVIVQRGAHHTVGMSITTSHGDGSKTFTALI